MEQGLSGEPWANNSSSNAANADTLLTKENKKMRIWKDYDPSWLVKLAEEQLPDKPKIAMALRDCKRASEESPAYFHFAEWSYRDYDGIVELEDPTMGTLYLDRFSDGRIGGVEILDRIPK